MAFEALDEFLSTAQTVDWKVGVDGPLIVAKGTFSEGLLTRLEDEGLFLTAAGAGPGETQVKVTRDRRSFVAEKFDDFLTAGCEGLVKPDQFRIITGRGPELDENLSFLDECLAFKAALDLLADHSESGAWIFLQIRKLVVRRTISAQDFGLAKGKREVLKRAVSFLADASSEHARSEIFRGALISEFKAGRGGPVTTFGEGKPGENPLRAGERPKGAGGLVDGARRGAGGDLLPDSERRGSVADGIRDPDGLGQGSREAERGGEDRKGAMARLPPHDGERASGRWGGHCDGGGYSRPRERSDDGPV